MLRTHTCGEVGNKLEGKRVVLSGWIDSIRSHGAVSFIDLRDRYGKVQVVFTKKNEHFDVVQKLGMESCISVEGEVKLRKKGTENKDLENGDIEILGDGLKVFNSSKVLPFELNDEKVGEDVRLKGRFLDLRSERLKNNLILRDKIYQAIHEFMSGEDFLYVDTPMLAKSTPEGARDFLVPSRVHEGKFYALPQSPQLFKQLLMMSGFDKYYQIARCFRDEDLRADRQPEFTQLDVEMSFIEVEDIIGTMERLVKHVFDKALGVDIKIPFPRMSYDEAMEKYGRDNPDTRKNGEDFAFTWVLDFPMFEWNDEENRWQAMHHPFTSPEDGADMTEPKKLKAKAYDLVLNGSEIAGGSIRIHSPELQQEVFKILNIGDKEANDKFGFLLDALSYGAPPHGGIAFGLDRLAAIMSKSESIRDVIAFPKNRTGNDVMIDAPASVNEKQLKEAHIKIEKKEKKK